MCPNGNLAQLPDREKNSFLQNPSEQLLAHPTATVSVAAMDTTLGHFVNFISLIIQNRST